jgi:hypothetical protein
MAFIEAERTQLWLRCALFGPSGSGKTMTALRMAKGIAEKMGLRYAVIDTEARSASKYADRYYFVVDNLTDKTVDGYIASMHQAYEAGYKVLVIDSLSHAWRELTDEVDRLTQASTSKNSLLSWAKINPKQKRLVEAILGFPGHLIATMRSKTEWVIGEGRNGKNMAEKIGLAPEQGKGLEYEFDLLMELNQKHQATITKDRTGKFQDEVIDKPGETFGIALYDWLTIGNAVVPPASPPVIPQQSAIPQKEAIPVTTASTASPAQSTTPQPASTPAPVSDDPKQAELKATGTTLIQEIGKILNTTAQNGQPYFSEADKAEARQIVAEIKPSEEGISKLRDLSFFLTEQLTERITFKPGKKKSAA